MLTGEAYHRIVQIIIKLVSNFVINGSRHAQYLVCYPLDVMYEMKKTHCGRGLADNLIEDKTRDYIAFLTIISNNPIKHHLQFVHIRIRMERWWPKYIKDIIFTPS